MQESLTCHVEWSEPASRRVLLTSHLKRANYVYAITIVDGDMRSALRIGTSADFAGRLRGYAILDFIADASLSYCVIPGDFKEQLRPRLEEFYVEANRGDTGWPAFMKDKSPAKCIERDLATVQYRVERLLLTRYRCRHGALPRANAMPGSYRPYLENITVEESDLRVLDMRPARLAPITLEEAQLLRLIGGQGDRREASTQ